MSSTRAIAGILVLLSASAAGAVEWPTHAGGPRRLFFNAQCTGGSCGSRMPANQPQLPIGVRQAISAWIAAGALDDCP
jgi:hypothetical protein